MRLKLLNLILTLFLIGSHEIHAAKLIDIKPIDNQCLVIHWQDGFVKYNWDDTTSGSCSGWDYYFTEDWDLCKDKDQYLPFGNPLNTETVSSALNYNISSLTDEKYGQNGKNPTTIYRKSKVWEASFVEKKPAMHHWIYLQLPEPLTQGANYKIKFSDTSWSDSNEYLLNYDVYRSESPAIKISNVGYQFDATHKLADIYVWMGNGGEYSFSKHTGAKFHLYDLAKKENVFSGTLQNRTMNKNEPFYNVSFTGSAVWECNFSALIEKGRYRLVIEGVGCSKEFQIKDTLMEEPFKVAMQGMFYQRMGCEAKPFGNYPYSRRPLFKQGVDPSNFEVKISNKNMVEGENPDNRSYYSSSLSGETATATWGGWSDAYDNDQRPLNFVCVFDLLLTYYLNPESFTDNQLYIPEWNNRVPDILDEARWEIDWWLRMRDSKGGYLTGLTNITPPTSINYAGAACAWQGWCVAAGCAMLADCFRLGKNDSLKNYYQQEAINAYNWASVQSNQMLTYKVDALRGRDLKLTAASFLYNLTNQKTYEEVIQSLSGIKNTTSKILSIGQWAQHYATVGYLFSPNQINYPDLYNNMAQSTLYQAENDYLKNMRQSPTKYARWPNSWEGMYQTSNEVTMLAIAHRITLDKKLKYEYEQGLYAEAEWTLGRNPLGLIQMTGFGELGFTQTFAPGRRDGYEGLTPGWTPFMCRDGWKNSDDIVRCEWYTNRNFPADKLVWPYGEHFWNSRYNVPNAEATPHQNFRQKILLYGYLYGMVKAGISSKSLPVDSIDIQMVNESLLIQESRQLQVEVYPKNALYSALRWFSSDTSIAIVNENGKVTGKKAGEVEIRVQSIDGSVHTSIALEVLNPYAQIQQIDNENFSLFPNPMLLNQQLSIKNNQMIQRIIFFDSSGKIVYEQNSDFQIINYPFEGIVKGMYYVFIQSELNNIVRKLVIL